MPYLFRHPRRYPQPTAANKALNPKTIRTKAVKAKISKTIYHNLSQAALAQVLEDHRKKKQQEKKRAARARQFNIWEDHTATPLSDAALFEELREKTQAQIRNSSSSGPTLVQGEEIKTATEPVDIVFAQVNYDGSSRTQSTVEEVPLSPKSCEAPWSKPEPTSGDSWNRLVTDPIFVKNNQSVLALLRTLHRLKNRYPLTDDGRVTFPCYGRCDRDVLLEWEDADLACWTLENVQYAEIFDSPIWEGWRTAPGDDTRDAEKDPDMDRIMAALKQQRGAFDRLTAELSTYNSSFVQYISCAIEQESCPGGIGPIPPELGLPLISDMPWEERLEVVALELNFNDWNTEWTRSMR